MLSPSRDRFSSVEAPICGVKIVWGADRAANLPGVPFVHIGGVASQPSRNEPRGYIRFDDDLARHVLMMRTPGFILAIAVAFIMPRVSSVKGVCNDM